MTCPHCYGNLICDGRHGQVDHGQFKTYTAWFCILCNRSYITGIIARPMENIDDQQKPT